MILNQKYYICEELGQGGSGRVFLVKDLKLDKYWAIKFFHNSKKTENEIQILKSLDHPMIPRIVEYLTYGEYTGVVMDYLEGSNLAVICQSGYSFTVIQCLRLGIDICDVLEYLHQKENPIIYRDLKPQNLILTSQGQLKLIDFDCACFEKERGNAEFAGTKGYAAPEQYQGDYDHRVDIYALGMTLETLCKKRKPRLFRKIIKKCRHQSAVKRYRTVGEVQKDLKKALDLMLNQKKTWHMLTGTVGVLVILAILKIFILNGSEAAALSAVKNREYIEAIAIFPEREVYYAGMLEEGIRNGKTQETIEIIREFQLMYPEETKTHDTIRMKIGRLYLQGNVLDETFLVNYEKSREWYVSVSKDDDPEVQSSLKLLEILTKSGTSISWKEAADAMKTLRAKLQNESDIQYHQTMCGTLSSVWLANRYYFSQCGENPVKECISLLEEASMLINGNNDLQEIRLQISLAQAYFLDGVLENNKRSLEKSLDGYRSLKQEEMLTDMMKEMITVKTAYLHEELKLYEEAALIYEELIEQYPENVDYFCSYALMELLHCENKEKANELLQIAEKLPKAEKHQNYHVLKERLKGSK